ncbi:MAG: transporter [Nitrospirae bacterium]|nr:transporter [Nitrospirota bacterium]
MKLLKVVFTSLILLWAAAAFAAHPLTTDDKGTQGQKKMQLEINSEYSYDRETVDEITAKETGGEVAAIFSYGIRDNIDIVLGLPYQWSKVDEDGEIVSDENGLSDMSFELKWTFYENNGSGFALKPGITFPTGDDKKGLGAGRTTYSMFLITSHEIGPWTHHMNLGYIRNENRLDERKDLWHASLASEIGVAEDLGIVVNIGAEKNPDPASRVCPAFILGGIIYSITENLDIDLGVKGGINKPETDVTYLAGTAIRF